MLQNDQGVEIIAISTIQLFPFLLKYLLGVLFLLRKAVFLIKVS